MLNFDKQALAPVAQDGAVINGANERYRLMNDGVGC